MTLKIDVYSVILLTYRASILSDFVNQDTIRIYLCVSFYKPLVNLSRGPTCSSGLWGITKMNSKCLMCREDLPGKLGRRRAYLQVAKRDKLKEARIVINKLSRRVNNRKGMDFERKCWNNKQIINWSWINLEMQRFIIAKVWNVF